MGHRTVDLLVDILLESGPASAAPRDAEEMSRIACRPRREAPQVLRPLLAQLERDVLPFTSEPAHPGYFAFIPSCGTLPGALGDFLASALNVYVGSWMEAAGPSRARARGARLVQGVDRLPRRAAGVARERRLVGEHDGARVRARGARSGRWTTAPSSTSPTRRIRRSRARRVCSASVPTRCACSRASRRSPPARNRGRGDRRRRRRGPAPLLVAAAAGATNTGAVDPLAELAAVCRERGIWLHVDGAYGGFAALTGRGRRALAGIELADSVTLDPHKWLYQPFECGSLLVREGHLLAARSRSRRTTSATRGRRRRGGELRRPRATAHPVVARAQGLALGPRLRGRRRSARRSTGRSTSQRSPAAASRSRRSSS